MCLIEGNIKRSADWPVEEAVEMGKTDPMQSAIASAVEDMSNYRADVRMTAFSVADDEFAYLVEDLLNQGRLLIQRDREVRSPTQMLRIASTRTFGLDEAVWGMPRPGRVLTPVEVEVRDLIIAARRYALYMLQRIDEPMVLSLPTGDGMHVVIPYTTIGITIRGRFEGRLPLPEEVVEDIRRFLAAHIGQDGMNVQHLIAGAQEGVATEIRRVVRNYALRRDAYLGWVSLFIAAHDLFRARMGRWSREAYEADDAGDDSDSGSDDSGASGGGHDGGQDQDPNNNGGGAAPGQALLVA